MKAYGVVDVQIHIFLISALVSGEWSASRPGRFTPGVPTEQKAVLAPEPVWTTWRIENSWPYRDSNYDLLVVQPVTIRYTDWAGLKK
jgi:hypothetical protein